MTTVILEQRTSKGCLRVEPSDNPDFPGFTLSLDDQQVGVFEYNSVQGAIHLHVWTADTEDPAATFTLERAS